MLKGIVVTLVEKVNKVLIPAIVAFEHERELAANSPNDCYDSSSSTAKVSPVTSSSCCSMPEVRVTYPDYTLPTSRGPSRVELWSVSSPEDGQDYDRLRLGKKVIAPTASLLLRVENLIKDIIKDSVEVFTAQTGQANVMASVNIATDAGAKTEPDAEIIETKPKEVRVMDVVAERCCMVSPETTDTTTTDATALSSEATALSSDATASSSDATALSSDDTDDIAFVISNTIAPVTMDTIASTTDKTAVVIMNTTTAVTMDTLGPTDQIAVITMNTATTVIAETFATTDKTAVVSLNSPTGDATDTIGPTDKTAVVTMNTTTAVTMDTTATLHKSAVVTLNTPTAVTTETTSNTDKTTVETLNTAIAATMDTIATMNKTDVTLNATTCVTTDATTVSNMDTTCMDTDLNTDRHLNKQLREGKEKDSKQQLEAKDATNSCPEISESEASHVTEEVDDDSEGSSAFVVSLEKSIQLSSDQVDEILEKVTCILEEERPYLWVPSDMLTLEDGPASDLEPTFPSPNCVIFAIIQKMQLDKYLERKLMSFFAGRQMTSQGIVSMSPSASSLRGAQESLSWNSLAEVNPHSIKVTKWLLQTIQRRNCWQGNMTSDLEAMDVRQMREKHLICEVIHALLDHLNNVSTTQSISRQTRSETDVCGLGIVAHGGPLHVDTVVSETSLAASELTNDVMSKLVLEDNP